MKERVFRFRPLERELVASRPGARVLDIGCGSGDNLRRLARYGGRPFGLEPHPERVGEARRRTGRPAVRGVAEHLPFADGAFDLVYICHVLHHARDVAASLREICRVLAPGGVLFLIETVDDSPLMRLARRLEPRWDDDEVLNRFRFGELLGRIAEQGLAPRAGELFNWMYFAWELLPLAFRPFELLTPLFIGLEAGLAPLLDRWGGHCWILAEKPGEPRFPREAVDRIAGGAALPGPAPLPAGG